MRKAFNLKKLNSYLTIDLSDEENIEHDFNYKTDQIP